MTHIKYPGPAPWPEIERHNQLDLVNERGAYAAAWDVWRDNAHIWRSYPVETAESVEAWAVRSLVPGVAANHDDGFWGITGVVNVDLYPVPTRQSVEQYPSVASIRDAGATYLALAQMTSGALYGYDLLPPETTLYTKVRRARDSAYIWKLYEPVTCISVRGLIIHAERTKRPDTVPRHRFRAYLEHRPDSRIVDNLTLSERQATLEAPMKPNHIIRAAKVALGIPQWMTYRRDNTLTWALVGAPYQVRIVIVDDSTAGQYQ